MTSKIIITKLHERLPNGDYAGAEASVTLSDGSTKSWTGKLSDGSAYDGGEIAEGVRVVSSNSTGLFAWTIIEPPAPPAPPKPPVKPRKAPEKTAETGKVRQARNERSLKKP